METINREHPEYIGRKAVWKQYRDLYAGGEQLRANASSYLVRRHKEPGEIYLERLGRVFYENYIGSIIDWFAATLMRCEPALLFDGSDPAAQAFYSAFSDDCDLKGTSLTEFFRQRFVQTLVCGSSYVVVDFPRASGEARSRAEEDACGQSRPPVQMGGHAATSHLVPCCCRPIEKSRTGRLAAVMALCFGCGTRRVSQCAHPLPMKFVQKVGRPSFAVAPLRRVEDFRRAVVSRGHRNKEGTNALLQRHQVGLIVSL